MADEDVRLAHNAVEARLREAAVPPPSPQPKVETHTEAMATTHEGRPTVAAQQKQDWRVYP